MSTDTPAKQTSFEDKVNATVGTMVQGADGTWALPEGVELDEPTQYAVNAERRRRDTQAAYSRSQSETKRLKAENELLAKNWEQDAAKQLSPEQQEELADLKVTDPDAWRAKITEYEEANRTKFSSTRQEISKKAGEETELEARERQLSEFLEKNPGFKFDDDVIANDLPPRYMKQLEEGKISFDEFLAQSHHFLTTGKTLAKGEEPLKGPNLGALGGRSTPEQQAIDKESRATYKNETY